MKLVTFGGGSEVWNRSRARLEFEATRSGAFSSVQAFSPDDIRSELPSFWQHHRSFLERNPRGFGYWIWKPAIVAHALSNLGSKESGVVYVDAGCTINLGNPIARERLARYEEMSQESGGLFFRLSDGNTHERYTKSGVIQALNGESFLGQSLFAATAFFIQGGQKQLGFINEWQNQLTRDDYALVRDSESIDLESDSFVEHRHDQSVLSLLLERENFSKIDDETYFSPNWRRDGKEYPIWASRNKSGFSFRGEGFSSKALRYLERSISSVRD
jgi:hypothetical protein